MVDTFVRAKETSQDEFVRIDTLFCTRWVLRSGYSFVMSPKMLVSEMHVKKFGHVDCSEKSVDKPLFVEDFMGNGELDWLKIWKNEDYTHEVQDWERCELVVDKDVHHLEKKGPIDDASEVKDELKPEVVFFERFSFLFVGIFPVQAEKLIEKGENGVNDGDEDECMRIEGKEAGECDGGENVVWSSAHHERATGVDVDFLVG